MKETKDVFVIVRVTKTIKNKLLALAREKGITMSILVRSMIKKYL